jgi:maltose/moltooligosaccharide transporter
MLFGAIGMFAGLILFSNAANIAGLFSDSVRKAGGRSTAGIVIAVLSFWILDIMINALQGPTRTLLGDVVPPERLALGNMFFAVANGFGKCIGYAIGAFSDRIEITYGLTASIALLFALITIATVKEDVLQDDHVQNQNVRDASNRLNTSPILGNDAEDLKRSPVRKRHIVASTIKRTWAGLFSMPKPIARAFIVQCFAYFAWMIVVVYAADFVGKDVFNGDADSVPGSTAHQNYDKGVRFANKGLLIMAILSIFVSGLLLPAIDLLGVKIVWGTCQIVFGVALLLTKIAATPTYVTIMFAALSLPFAASFIIPWAITALSLRDESERGMYMATFNISQSFPGIVASIAGGLIVKAGKGNLAYVMMLGGASALVAAVAVVFVISPLELQRKPWRVALHIPESKRHGRRQNDGDDPECPKGIMSPASKPAIPESQSVTTCL